MNNYTLCAFGLLAGLTTAFSWPLAVLVAVAGIGAGWMV